jgi:hypothetical protein
MSTPYVGEIRMFAGNFAPVGWALCDGTLLPIDQYETLFNLIGTTYGGDGQTTFALPNLQSRIPIHVGPGFTLAQQAGAESVTLTAGQIQCGNSIGPCRRSVGAVHAGSVFIGSPNRDHGSRCPRAGRRLATPRQHDAVSGG